MDAIFKLDQIEAVAKALWKRGEKHKIWAFYAPMGSGKTTFIHALCTMLGVQSAISSPTFAIVNEYNSRDVGVVYHMDWYRLKNKEEALQAGVEEMLHSGHYCFIEWPEQAADLLPEDVFRLSLEALDENTRRIFVMVDEAAEA